jgi:hypothetical protein
MEQTKDNNMLGDRMETTKKSFRIAEFWIDV